MVFKDLKVGTPIYVFDKGVMKVSEGKVLSKGIPHMSATQVGTMCLDIKIELEGNTYTLEVKDSGTIAYVQSSMSISPNKEDILKDVKATKQEAEDCLNNIDNLKAKVEHCNSIIKDLDSDYKMHMETEERLSKLEHTLDEIKTLLYANNKTSK